MLEFFMKQDVSSIPELDELKVHGLLQFVSLKKLNRIAHFRSKKVRDATSEVIDGYKLISC
jgi:hypothetical protein